MVLAEFDWTTGITREVFRVRGTAPQVVGLHSGQVVRGFDMDAYGNQLAIGLRTRPFETGRRTPDIRVMRVDVSQIE